MYIEAGNFLLRGPRGMYVTYGMGDPRINPERTGQVQYSRQLLVVRLLCSFVYSIAFVR